MLELLSHNHSGNPSLICCWYWRKLPLPLTVVLWGLKAAFTALRSAHLRFTLVFRTWCFNRQSLRRVEGCVCIIHRGSWSQRHYDTKITHPMPCSSANWTLSGKELLLTPTPWRLNKGMPNANAMVVLHLFSPVCWGYLCNFLPYKKITQSIHPLLTGGFGTGRTCKSNFCHTCI